MTAAPIPRSPTSSTDGHKPKASTCRDQHQPSNAQASKSTSDTRSADLNESAPTGE